MNIIKRKENGFYFMDNFEKGQNRNRFEMYGHVYVYFDAKSFN